MQKSFVFSAVFLLTLSVTAREKLVFSCDFSNGTAPQVCVQPCRVFQHGTEIVETENGKALRFGKAADGSLKYLTYKLKDASVPEKHQETELPFPLRFGKMTFRFRPVDWKLGEPPFNMFLRMTGPLQSTLYLLYTRPTTTGIPSVQAAYGQFRNQEIGKGQIPVIYPTVKLDRRKQWHSACFLWRPDHVELLVDGEKTLMSTRILAYPKKQFYATELQIGTYVSSLLRGMTDITDIRIWSMMPENRNSDRSLRYPELLVHPMQAPVIDGRISDCEWEKTCRYTGFSQLPGNRVGAHQPVIRLGYDSTHLYFAVSSTGHRRPPVMEKTKRDENLWEDDGVELYLGSLSGKKDFFQFIFSYGEQIFDQHFVPEKPLAECHSWNCRGIRSRVKIDGGIWSMEGAVPFASLGRKPPVPGTEWTFNLCQTLQGIGFFSLAPVMNSFSEQEHFGKLRFAAAGDPVIDFSDIGELFQGRAAFRCGVKQAAAVRMEVNAMRYDETAQTEFPLFGETVKVPEQPGICFNAGDDRLGKTGTLYTNLHAGDRRIYSGRFAYEVIQKAEIENLRRVVLHGKNFLRVSTAHASAGKNRLRLTIQDESGRRTASETVAVTGMKQETLFPLAGRKPGRYRMLAELVAEDGKVAQSAVPRDFIIYDDVPPWTGFVKKNISRDHVPAPWKPLQLKREKNGAVTVECWNRKYVFGGKSLFAEQLETGEKPLLVSPVELLLQTGKTTVSSLQKASVKTLSVSDRKVTLEISAQLSNGFRAVVRTDISYDGFIWYDVNLFPPEHRAPAVEKLSVRLRMDRERSRLLNSGDRSLQNTGRTPEKWSKCLDDTFGPFWIGSEIGGLSFGIESAENWHNRDRGQQARVMKKADHTLVDLNFIDMPVQMKRPLHYGFYIMPTPVRPRPENYRRLRSNSWFGHNRDQLNGTGYPCNFSWWTATYTYQGYPEYILDKKAIDEQSRKLADFGTLVRPYNHYHTLDRTRTRTAWYAAYSSIARNPPEVIWNGEAWRAGSRDILYGNTLYGYVMDMIEVCKTDDYCDFFLWRFDQSRKAHPQIDGLYFDLMMWPLCNRKDHGHGYADEHGHRRGTYGIRDHRKWQELIYLYCKEHAEQAPVIMHLSGATSRIAGFSFADYFLDGELWQNKLVKDRSYRDMKLDQLRAEILPQIWGQGMIWLSQLFRIQPFVPASQRKNWRVEPWAERHISGLLLLHDVIPDRTALNLTAWQVWKALDRFGLEDTDQMLPYWETDTGIGGDFDGENVAVTGYLKKQNARLMLVVFNNQDRPAQVRLSPDLRKLFGREGAVRVADLEKPGSSKICRSSFTVPVGMRNFRLLEVSME